MFENLLSWLLLPLGVMLGLSLARNRQAERAFKGRDAGADAAKTGSNPDDQAIATMNGPESETDASVVELQMTLGSLFRKRGEVERAIHLHERVLARQSLTGKEAAQARHELAQDYLRAGLMDGAESLLQTQVESGEQLGPALELLLDLYEQGRDWPQAITTAQRLEGVLGSSQAARIGQYRCELAESALHDGDIDTAAREIERALDTDRDGVRANLLLAALAEKREDWSTAIRALTRAAEQDRRYLPEILAPLKRAFESAGKAAAYAQYLADAELDHPDSYAIALAKVQLMRAAGADAQAYLAGRLAAKPDWRALLVWLEAQPGADAPAAVRVREGLRKKLEARPRYVCSSCGLTPSVLFWQCPGCKHWATVAPSGDGV